MTGTVPSPDPVRAALLKDLWHGGMIECQDHCNMWAADYGLTRAQFDIHVQALIDAGVAELSDDAEQSPVLTEARFIDDGPVRRLYGQLTGARTCRVCGCSDAWGCDGGCWWTRPDLCSSCEDQEGLS